MKVSKNVSIGVLVIGIIILVVSLFADPIGVGGGGSFGTRQVIGTIVGAVVTVVGLALTFRQR